MSAPVGSRRDVLTRRIRLLVAATIAYNVVEAVIALTEGTACRRRRCSVSGSTR